MKCWWFLSIGLGWGVEILLGPVYMGPDKFLHGQKVARFHLAFTRDCRNWTNIWTATCKCASLGPEKSRSQTCTLSRSNIRPVPPVLCKCKVEPCNFLSVLKFVRTRVNRALFADHATETRDKTCGDKPQGLLVTDLIIYLKVSHPGKLYILPMD